MAINVIRYIIHRGVQEKRMHLPNVPVPDDIITEFSRYRNSQTIIYR